MIELTGYLEDGQQRTPFTLRVLAPRRDEAGGDWFVEVEAPSILRGTARIFGIDGNQAQELAIRYLTARLKGRLIYDEGGRRVEVRELLQQKKA